VVKLVQMLCPQRHCLLASAYAEGAGNFLEACEQLEGIIRDAGMNRWCAICGSRDLRFEEGTTSYQTMAEALPHLMANEQRCIDSRRLLDSLGQTAAGAGSFDLDKIMRETRRRWR